VIVEGHNTVAASGSLAVPDTSATGSVTFTNLTSETVPIPSGTIVRTAQESVIRFAVSRGGELAAGSGSTVELPIVALEAGSSGNLPGNRITAVEGELGLSVAVINFNPTEGGAETSLTSATDADRHRAYRELLDSLRLAAAEEILLLLSPEDVLLTATPFLKNTFLETYLPEEGQPGDSLEVELRLEFEARIIAYEDLISLAQAVLDSGLTAGFIPAEESPEINLLGQPTVDAEGAGEWQVQASRVVRAAPSSSAVVNSILGSSPEAAVQLLATTEQLRQPPVIEMSPAWWPWLPLLPIQIEVILE